MKNTVIAHPEAMLHSICDVQSSLENKNLLCKIMVMSHSCYACLLQEDRKNNGNGLNVHDADKTEFLEYGYQATMWGSFIYVDQNSQTYEIEAYGGDCNELQTDHPDMWYRAQEIINL
jgi:hypothetical protein